MKASHDEPRGGGSHPETRRLVVEYLDRFDFTQQKRTPQLTEMVERLLEILDEDPERKTAVAIEKLPFGLRAELASRIKKLEAKAAERLQKRILDTFSKCPEFLQALRVKPTQMMLVPILDEVDPDGLTDAELDAVMFRDSLGIAYAAARPAQVRSNSQKLLQNLTRCRDGYRESLEWVSIHDLLPNPNELSLLDWFIAATPAERLRMAKILVSRGPASNGGKS